MALPQKILQNERISAVLMVAALLSGLVAAYSPSGPTSIFVHHVPVHFRFGPLIIDEPLIGWINEGMMVFFFLMAGFEIKRKLPVAYLSTVGIAADIER